MDKRIIEETPSSEVLNDDWFIKDSPTGGTSKILGSNLKDIISGDVEDAIDKILSSIATEWRANESYSNGTYVMYEGELYVCFVNGSTVGQFKKNTEWLHRTVNSMVTKVIRMIAQRFYASTVSPPRITPYSKGDLVWYSQPYHEDELYICKQDLPNGDTEWVANHWEEVNTVSGLSKYLMDKIAEAGQVDDVKVDGTSVVTNKVAEIEIPVKDVEVDGTSVVNASGVAEITLPDVPVQDVQVKTDSAFDSVVDASGNAKIDLSSVTAYGSVPNLPQAIATFKDGADAPMKSLKVAIEPQQDLHGYDAPWVGGAGKNKLQVKATSQTIAGVMVTVKDDGTFIANGTATQNISLQLSRKSVNGTPLPEGQLTMTGCPSGGSTSSYYLTCWRTNSGNANDVGNGNTFSYQSDWDFVVSLVITSGTTCNNLTFKPMIRLASVADATFAPYSNICPISGWDEVDVTRTGKNLYKAELNNYYLDVTTGLPVVQAGYEVSGFIPILANQSIYIPAGGTSRRWFYDKFKNPKTYLNNSENQTYTAQEDGYIRVTLAKTSTAYSTYQIEYGTTATTYEPYNGLTYTIDLDGTRYGCTLDVSSGTLVVDRYKGILAPATSNITVSSAKQCIFPTPAVANGYTLAATKLMCDKLKPSNYSTTEDNHIMNSNASLFSIVLSDEVGTTKEAWAQWFTDMQITVCYKIATPITVQLSPTAVKSLLGSNNVWANTGDVNKCVYRRDMSSTIDDIIARLEALENA